MIKKIIIIALLIGSINAKDTKYLDEKDYSNNDFRIFVGLGASMSYLRSSEDLDKYMYSYSFYIGMPIFWGNELIIKKTKNIIDQFDINEQELILNIPFDSRDTRQSYYGIVFGQGEVKWNNTDATNFNVTKKTIEDTYYGVHIGKRYKFTRNYYVRIELEAIKYNFKTPTTNEDITNDYSVSFNYGFEYRF